MNTQNTNARQDSEAGNDKNIDVTRSEQRQAVNDSTAADNTGDQREGDGAESGNSHMQKTSHTGGHAEGTYNKNQDQSTPTQNSDAPGQVGKPGDRAE
jgi:hypothetical protein